MDWIWKMSEKKENSFFLLGQTASYLLKLSSDIPIQVSIF